MKGTFLTLNPKAKIYEELKTQQLKWWTVLREDNELYIEIHQDDLMADWELAVNGEKTFPIKGLDQ
ncbi:hypothetical protein [Chitinivibrio alkaliphilus]|uniref:Uncharacterized protein n=1 Tax=Chitinivibrio alkaliphilus ACht1 TaxID=1313304 RepID=U7D7C1_9BACT|nr:hypothetical protein [Chitinivibrio alkaliphilus]ERP30997.1 hypothetical protein CALK_2134 [Chitinivibrio alkaliphilus ACht1]